MCERSNKLYPEQVTIMRNWIFQAEAPYEMSGLTPNVVFPTGLLLRDDELWMYYGAADSCTCLSTAKLDEVLALLVD